MAVPCELEILRGLALQGQIHYLARYYLVAFVSPSWYRFKRSSPWGSHYAIDIEADSVSMRVADLLVSDSIRLASTFERYRAGNLHRLYCRPLSIPPDLYHSTEHRVRPQYLPLNRSHFPPSSNE